MPFDLDISLIIILIFFGFLAAFVDSVVGGGGLLCYQPCYLRGLVLPLL